MTELYLYYVIDTEYSINYIYDLFQYCLWQSFICNT